MTEVRPSLRRVRIEDWRDIRDLRIEAVSDPAAGIAFWTTPLEERERDDAFWRRRAADASLSADTAQFVAEVDGRWVGTATVILRSAGSPGHPDGPGSPDRADLAAIYVAPDHRGTGVVDGLVAVAAAWASDHGIPDLTLTTHVDNHRAQAAYRRLGFAPTGQTVRSPIGSELVMRRPGTVSA